MQYALDHLLTVTIFAMLVVNSGFSPSWGVYVYVCVCVPVHVD